MLLFLRRQALHIELLNIENIERARRPKRVPVVLAPVEVEAVYGGFEGKPFAAESDHLRSF